jgi:Tol biopolymer transport system component
MTFLLKANQRYFLLLIGVVFWATAGMADQKDPQKNAALGSPSTQVQRFQSVIVRSTDGQQGRHAIPFSLSAGKPLTRPADFLAPKWSPDARFVLLTKAKYRGLYLFSMADGTTRTLSDAPGIGYGARWSTDSQRVITSGEEQTIAFDLSGKMVSSLKGAPHEQGPQVNIMEDGVYFSAEKGGTAVKISPDGDVFFAPTLSPDQKKVAYVGLSTGIRISNMDTKKTVSIGLGTDIGWLPDSTGIVYTHSRDDGHVITASDIYFARVDGRLVVNLTNTPETHESHPDMGGGLLYMVDGQLFLAQLTQPLP